jgi:hypothetical protein
MFSPPRLFSVMNAIPLFLAGALLAEPAFAAHTVLPEPLPASRYEKMIESSPFALATATAAPAEKGPGPFANLFVSAIAQLKDADGKVQDVVTIKSRGDQSTFTLVGNDANKDGMQLASIEWSDKVGATKVTLKKGTEFGTVEFDQANLQGPSQPAPVPRALQPGGVPLPAVPGGNPQQRPGARLPVVPRPTTVPPVPNAAVPAQAVQPNAAQGVQQGTTPRRVRVINSKP